MARGSQGIGAHPGSLCVRDTDNSPSQGEQNHIRKSDLGREWPAEMKQSGPQVVVFSNNIYSVEYWLVQVELVQLAPANPAESGRDY